MPPGALMPVVDHLPGLRGCLGTLMPKVDHLPWPLQLPGLPLPTHLPNTNSPMLQTSGSKAAKQVFGLRRSPEVEQS